MIAAPIPRNDRERVAALKDLHLLDTPPEERFDQLCQLAMAALQTPMASISLIDADRQWCKASPGMASPHVARDISFCGHTVAGGELVIVEDATKDPRFIGNPLVTGEARLRAYIGIPLFTEAGYCVGSFCVLDREPRRFDENQVATLRNLAVMAQKELNNVGLNRNLAAAEPIAPAPVTAEAPFGARGWDILVVDDNPVNQHVIRMFLQKFGCAVECVDGGSECLQWLSERTCDLVFMDVQMPDMDGYETARRIRATEPGSRKPWIVALTAHAMAEAREMCLEAGMDDYLTKPVRRDMLREALDRFAASREA